MEMTVWFPIKKIIEEIENDPQIKAGSSFFISIPSEMKFRKIRLAVNESWPTSNFDNIVINSIDNREVHIQGAS